MRTFADPLLMGQRRVYLPTFAAHIKERMLLGCGMDVMMVQFLMRDCIVAIKTADPTRTTPYDTLDPEQPHLRYLPNDQFVRTILRRLNIVQRQACVLVLTISVSSLQRAGTVKTHLIFVLTTFPTYSESFWSAFSEIYLRLSEITFIRGSSLPSSDIAI